MAVGYICRSVTAGLVVSRVKHTYANVEADGKAVHCAPAIVVLDSVTEVTGHVMPALTHVPSCGCEKHHNGRAAADDFPVVYSPKTSSCSTAYLRSR